LHAFQNAITDSNINTTFSCVSPLAEVVSLNWHEAASWLISRGASVWYEDNGGLQRSVVSLTYDMAMVRLLGLHVDSPCFLGSIQTRLCQMLKYWVYEERRSFIVELIDAGAQLCYVTARHIQILPWIQQLVDGRERCRHVALFMMHGASERRDIMRLIAREVWNTRLEVDVWSPVVVPPSLRRKSTRLNKP